MPTIVREFIQLYPDIDLTLKYIRTQGQKIDLARNEIDAGFMLGPFWHQQFACQPISRELLMAVLPVNHRLAGRTSVTLAELSATRSSWAAWRSGIFPAPSGRCLRLGGVEVETCRYEVSDALGILGLVGAGLGVSIFPSSIMRFQPRTVMTVPISDPKGAIETILMWNRAYRNKVLDNFISVARETYGPMGRQY
jgi:DNA-binding transcriptional LysR family regulator